MVISRTSDPLAVDEVVTKIPVSTSSTSPWSADSSSKSSKVLVAHRRRLARRPEQRTWPNRFLLTSKVKESQIPETGNSSNEILKHNAKKGEQQQTATSCFRPAAKTQTLRTQPGLFSNHCIHGKSKKTSTNLLIEDNRDDALGVIDEKEENKDASPLGLNLTVNMMSASTLSDVTSPPPVRPRRHDSEILERDGVENNARTVALSSLKEVEATAVTCEISRRGLEGTLPDHYPAFRSSYMKESFGQKYDHEAVIGSKQPVQRQDQMKIRGMSGSVKEVNETQLTERFRLDPTFHKVHRFFKKTESCNVESRQDMEDLPRRQKAIVTIPADLMMQFGIHNHALRLSRHAVTETHGSLGQGETKNVQRTGDEPTKSLYDEEVFLPHTLLEEPGQGQASSITPKLLEEQEETRRHEVVPKKYGSLFTSRPRRGKLKRVVVAKQVGLRHGRVSVAPNELQERQQVEARKTLRLRRPGRKGMVIRVPVDNQSMESYLSNLTSPLPPTVEPRKANSIKGCQSTTETVGFDFCGHVPYALCGLGLPTWIFSGDEKPREHSSKTKQCKVPDADGSSTASLFADENYFWDDEAVVGSFFIDTANSCTNHGQEKTGAPEKPSPQSERKPPQICSILKSSTGKDTTAGPSGVARCVSQKPPRTKVGFKGYKREKRIPDDDRKTVTFGPDIPISDTGRNINTIAYDNDSPFGEFVTLAAGSCGSCTLRDEDTKSKGKFVPTWHSKSSLDSPVSPGGCVPVTNEIVYELNEFFTERKALKNNRIVSLEGEVASVAALQRRLLKLRGDQVCSLIGMKKDTGFDAQKHSRYKVAKTAHRKPLKSLFDDLSTCEQKHSGAASKWKTGYSENGFIFFTKNKNKRAVTTKVK